MATRVAPARIDTVNSAGSLRADLNDCRSVSRFHVGTGQIEPTIDAGYLGPRMGIRPHALSSGQNYRSVSLLFWGAHVERLERMRVEKLFQGVSSQRRRYARDVRAPKATS